MNAAIPLHQDDPGMLFLRQLQMLTGEIEGAMRAIAADDLDSFTESVARQQVLASALFALAKSAPLRGRGDGWDINFKLAGRALHMANLGYAALLKNARKTNEMLAMLRRSHAGEMTEVGGAAQKLLTWSCEA